MRKLDLRWKVLYQILSKNYIITVDNGYIYSKGSAGKKLEVTLL